MTGEQTDPSGSSRNVLESTNGPETQRHVGNGEAFTYAFPLKILHAVHTDKVLRLSVDLPLIIEVVETDEAIQAILPDLSEMIGGGLITLEKAHVILYRPGT